jgi:prephenate dehydratase
MGEALQGLHRVCAEVRFLGSYPRAASLGSTLDDLTVPPGTSDQDFAESVRWLARIRAGEVE